MKINKEQIARYLLETEETFFDRAMDEVENLDEKELKEKQKEAEEYFNIKG